MTLKEFVCNALAQQGVQQATGVKVMFNDGRSLTIHSDDHPALANVVSASDRPTITLMQSAQGGM